MFNLSKLEYLQLKGKKFILECSDHQYVARDHVSGQKEWVDKGIRIPTENGLGSGLAFDVWCSGEAWIEQRPDVNCL